MVAQKMASKALLDASVVRSDARLEHDRDEEAQIRSRAQDTGQDQEAPLPLRLCPSPAVVATVAAAGLANN